MQSLNSHTLRWTTLINNTHNYMNSVQSTQKILGLLPAPLPLFYADLHGIIEIKRLDPYSGYHVRYTTLNHDCFR